MYVFWDEIFYFGEVFVIGILLNGCVMENYCWLKFGDIIEFKIERIGSLINCIELECS